MAVSLASTAVNAFLADLGDGIDRVPPGASVVLAVSGGADSVALLSAWARLGQTRRHALTVAHYDHAWRSDSELDARFVADLASRHRLPCVVERAASTPDRPCEADARERRYAFLRESARRAGASFVATGHTRDDQVETVLHGFVRGSGLRGLAGMPVRRPLADDVTLIRPMLHLSRKSAVDFLTALGESYRNDSSNDGDAYTRNRIRHEALPLLRERIHREADASILRLSLIAGEYAALIEGMADGALRTATRNQSATEVVLETPAIQALAPVLIAEVFRSLWRSQRWPLGRMGANEWRRLSRWATGAGPGTFDLPDGVRVERRERPASLLWLRRLETP